MAEGRNSRDTPFAEVRIARSTKVEGPVLHQLLFAVLHVGVRLQKGAAGLMLPFARC